MARRASLRAKVSAATAPQAANGKAQASVQVKMALVITKINIHSGLPQFSQFWPLVSVYIINSPKI